MIFISFTSHLPANFSILRPPLRLSTTTTTTATTLHFHPYSRHRFLYRAPQLRPLRPSLSPCALRAGAGDLIHDAGATGLVLAGAYALVFIFDNLTQRNLIQQNSNSIGARCFASLVPLVNCLRLVVHGLQLVDDKGLVKSVTREGNPKELLRGPLYYVLILILSALMFWRESPVGVISLAMMCGGDGVADIMGRNFGSTKIPYNPSKSWAGSISMFVFGFLVSVGMLYYYSALGYLELDWAMTVQRVALVSLVATVVESLPITKVIDDNISVPLASMATAFLSFGF
ncbi:hypothetical protein FNV43_RR25225 [Rhamnella rubrinervis]|uniref:phytol kinase n=1 Tax=Rhamnella rubrinervis TaxID=2594499 RepID=A0A8K0DZL3_9ROSA|nr:hypothetical protein FNV43_RR25225 [Rhamnella rubrinervis]